MAKIVHNQRLFVIENYMNDVNGFPFFLPLTRNNV